MRFIKTKKGFAFVAAVVAVAAAAVGAYAYFTATGSGTGSSTTPTTINGWQVTGYTDAGSLWPGTADNLTTGIVTNPSSNAGALHLSTVTVSITNINVIGQTGCDKSQFVFVDPGANWTITGSGTTAQAVFNANAAVASGANAVLPALQLELKDSGSSQNNCSHANISLSTAAA